ncbi:MAG: hypothetical protein AB7S38_08260 [Vulcanimicrobiota bacterium]
MRELICPECQAEIVVLDDKTAYCPRHGGKFKLLHLAPASRVELARELETTTPGPGVGNQKCHYHQEVDARFLCRGCGKPCCRLCTFAIGMMKLCADCATTGPEPLIPKRKKLVDNALRLAGLATFFFVGIIVLLVSGSDLLAILGVLGIFLIPFFVMIPSTVGFFMALEAVDRHLENPVVLWGALIWNGLIFSIFAYLGLRFLVALFLGV